MNEGLSAKTNALEIFEKQLRVQAGKKAHGFVALGSATDAYLHQEESRLLSQGMLKLLFKYRFPVFISTKSTMIMRDIELLKQINESAIIPLDLGSEMKHGVILSVSLSTTNPSITNMLEPGAASPNERLKLVQQLKAEGFLAGVNAIPVLPFISDTEEELEHMIGAASEHGADYILAGGLTLFGNEAADSRTLFYNFLKRYDARLIPRYEKLYGRNFFPPTQYQLDLKSRVAGIAAKHAIRTTILNAHVSGT